jgi:hypothetical protein
MKTTTAGIRLEDKHWCMWSALMQYHGGRIWIERAIEKEHEKMMRAKHGHMATKKRTG